MKDKELLKMFLRNGWEIRRIKGSHHHLFKDGKRETIAVHSDEINPNLAKKIIEKHNLK
nr:MAG TPA: hypothetical protein [Caudoviricetes sp.]